MGGGGAGGGERGKGQSGAGGRRQILSIRGTPAWRDWIDRLAHHCRLDRAKLIDIALYEKAKRSGFEEPPPER